MNLEVSMRNGSIGAEGAAVAATPSKVLQKGKSPRSGADLDIATKICPTRRDVHKALVLLRNSLRQNTLAKSSQGLEIRFEHFSAAMAFVESYWIEIVLEKSGSYVGTSRELNVFAEGLSIQDCLTATIEANVTAVAYILAAGGTPPSGTRARTPRNRRVSVRFDDVEYDSLINFAEQAYDGDVSRLVREATLSHVTPVRE